MLFVPSQDMGVGTDEVIALALLLGSDYTEGVRGVGIVNAMEVGRAARSAHPCLSADIVSAVKFGIAQNAAFDFPHFQGFDFDVMFFFLTLAIVCEFRFYIPWPCFGKPHVRGEVSYGAFIGRHQQRCHSSRNDLLQAMRPPVSSG